MKHFKSAVASAFVLLCTYVQAQDNSVGINTNSPNNNAVLELVSPNSDQGFLVPRVTAAQRTSMASSLGNADDGLMVFDTDVNLFYYWNNNNWSAGLGVLNVLAAGGDLTGNYPNPTIKLGAVVENRLGDLAVSTAKLQNNSVTTGKLDNGAVTTDKIANEAVTGNKLEDVGITPGTYGNQFTVLQLTADSKGRIVGIAETPILITSTHITDLSILNQDIADGTITISKIDPDGNSDKVLTINGSGQVVWADRSDFTSSALATDNIYVGNSSGVAEGLPVTGDVTVTNTGTAADIQLRTESVTSNEIENGGVESVDIANDAVTSAKINNGDVQTIDLANDAVDNSKLADNAVNTENITDGQVQTEDLANGSVTTDKLAVDAVDNSKLADDAVQSENIADGQVQTADIAELNVTTGKIADDAVTAAKINADVAGTGLQQNGTTGALEADFGSLAGALAGNGLNDDSADGDLDVQVDGSTIEIFGNDLRVVPEGITANEIATGAVNTDEIADGQVQTADIADLNVTTGKLAADAVDNTKLADNAVNTENITDGQVQTADIADLNVTTGKLAADAVDNTKLADNAVNTENITDGQVQTADIADLNVTTDKLAADAVDNTKLADNAVNTENITDGQVQTADIADDNVTAAKINPDVAGTGLQQNGTTGALEADFGNLAAALAGDGLNDDLADGDLDVQVDGSTIEITGNALNVVAEGITANEIATGAVNTDEIADGQVQTADIADLNVTTGKLANDAVDNSKLANNAVNTENITDGQVQTADIADLNVTTGKLAADAVDNSKLADNAVNTENITDGQVQTADIADLNVTTGKLAADAVDNSRLADNAVNTENIRDGEVQTADIGDANVTTIKIADDAVTAAKINADVAGTGLQQNGTTGALEADFGNLAGALAGDGLNDDLADGDLDVQVDGSTIEIFGNDLRVVPEGITANEIATGAVNSDEIANGTIADIDLDKSNIPLSGFGAAAADIDLGSNKIVNVADPTNAQDAATKNYVDTEISTETSALQAELDATQTGAGLAANGNYNTNTGTNYIDAATSLDNADDLLDAAIAGVQADVDGNETDSDNADAALQTELDDTQTGAGLAANGNYNTNTGTNYIDAATTLDGADDLLDAAIAGVQADVDGNETDSDNADAALQTELDDTQTGSGLAANGNYNTNTGTNYLDGATSLDNADDLLDAQVAVNAAAIAAGTGALQTELDDTQTGAGLAANGNYNTNTGTNYIDAATSLDNADDLLDAAIAGVQADVDGNETDSDNADAALQTELDDTQTGAGLAANGNYNTNTGTNYIDAATTLDGADDLLDAAIAGVQADVDGNETDSDNADAALQTELDDTQTGSGLAANGNYNTNTGTNYLDGATSLDNADDLLDAQVAVNAAAIAAGTGALQTELDDTQTGAGLAANGNYNTNTGTNYIDAATSLDNADDLLDAAIAGVQADVDGNETDSDNADAALQTELDDTQTGAGLGTDGSYATNTGTNYIDAATTLDGADDLLDAAIAGVQADVDGNETDSDNADAALQTELDDTQTGSGLAANGNYNTNTGTNYLDGATSLDNADDLLDAQVAVNTAAIAAGTGALQTELDDTQTGAGLAANGNYNTNTGTNYIDAATTLDGADDLLDAAIAGVQADVDGNETDSDNADAALQTELNDTQTGSGLAANGNYNTNTGTNYLDGATSLDNADDLLDAQVAVNTAAIAAGTGALQTELDDTQTGAGLGTDGSYATNTGTNYIDAATSLDNADDLLDAAIAGVQADVDGNETDSDNADAALQTELDDTQTGSGLAANGNYNTNTGTNYLDGATSLDNADDLLDAQVAVNAAAIAAGTGALQTELDDTQTGAGLAANGNYNTNTGTNYIDAATSLDNADDLLDAAIAGVQADVDGNETDSDNADAALQTELDDTQTGAGLGTDGSYATNTGTNYIDAATTLDGADDLLDAAIAGVQADVDGNETDSDNADAALQTELDDTQTGSGLAANGNYNTNTGTNYLDGATSLDNADDLLDAQVAVNTAAIAAGTGALQTELDDTQTGAGLAANGNYNTNTGTNYIDAATTLDGADDLLDAAIAGVQADVDGNETDSDNADAALQTELNDTQTGSGLAANGNYNTNTGTNYLDGATSLDNADDLLDAQVAVNTAAIAAGTGALQTELDDTQTGAGLGTDGSYATNTGTNYIDAATTLDGADDLLDAAIAGVQADVDGNETDSDNADAALQTELNDTQTGSGLAANGNYNTNTGTNYLDGATSLDNADDLLDAQVAVNTAAIAAGTGALQTELDDTQTGAGLGTDGSYATNTGTNYIDAATTLDGADDLLDAAIAGVQADVDGNETDSDNADAALQTELNDTQTGSGLAANGNYNTNTGTNYLDGATSLDNADDLLDAQVAVNTAAIAAGTGALQTELDDTQTGAGLGTDGSYATNTGTNYIDAATTLDGADDLLDAAIAGVQADVDGNETDSDNADAALQTELNDTQTGSGLAANGNYNTNTGTNYLDGATSLDNADDLLDAQVAVNTAAIAAGTGALQTELDDTQTGAGLGTDGSYATNTGTNYIDAATTLDGADDLLDAAIAGVQADVDGNETDSDNADAALQTELNDTQTGSGLAANGNYNTNTGTNYLDGATSLDNADDLLDAQVAVNTAAIAAGTGALQTELDDTQTGAGLGTDGSYATNTGTNYIDAATTLDGADDLLDAAIAGVQADVDGNETDSDNADAALQTELDDTQTGSGLAANGNYNTNTGTNYLDGATSLDNADDLLDAQVAVNTAAIAAGTGALQTELDDTQTGAGLGTDGSYATNTGTNYIDAATTLDGADDLLDAAIAGVQADVDGNETDSDNADAALQTELDDTQTGSGLAANGNYNTNTGTNYLDGATSLDNADDLLDAQVAVNTAAIAAGTGALQTELDDTQTGAGLGTDGSYATNTGTNYIDAATTLDGADDLLDAAIAGVQADVDGNETDSDNADAALQTELNDTQTGSGLAANGNYNTNTGTNYLDGATSLDNADDLLDAQVAVNTAAIAAGTGALQTELDDTQTGAGLGTDGSYATNTGTNYIDAATTLDGADDLLDAAIAGVQADVDGNETDSDNADAALQTELNDTQTGSGLAANGNYNTNTGTNYLDGATSLDNADDLLDAQVAVNTAAIAAGTGALQTELDDTQTGAGLGTDGSYATNTGTNYIDAATSLDNADDLLDAAIAGVQADVDGNETDSDNADAALQTELNDTQTGSGLAANGNYNTNTGTNYLDGATSLDNADDLLDAQVAVNTAAIAAGTGALQTELDDTQTGAGLGTDGSYATNTGTNYIDAATTLDGADDLLDAAIAGVQADVDGNETDSDNADAALQTELNDTQTGSGLAANGNYNTNTGTNYLDGATSLDNADDLLDAQVAVNTAAIAAGTGALQTELDDTQTGAGLGTDGSYATNTGTNYIDAATTLDGADDLLDAAIAGVQADVDGNETDSDNADAALQTELNDTQTGSGLAANGNYNTNTGTNYLDGATSLDNADDLLDAQVAVNTAAIAAGTGALQTELDDTQTGAGLAANGNYNTNTGTNYIDAATTLDGADDLLDAAIAGVQADVDGNETDSDNADAALQTELDDTQTGSGLAANGNYNTNTGTNYLDGATSLDNADDLLDAQVAVNTAAIAAGTGALQTELDDTQTGAGLGTDGSYATNTGTNYIDAATSLDNADDLLDAAIAGVQADVDGNETDSDNADAALQTELNDTQTGSGLAANGNYNTNTGTNYLDGATSLDNADDLLDAQVAVNTAAIAAGTGALQTELDDTQTGAGLGTDGSYATNTGTNYIDAATTLDGADDLLDAAIAGVQADVDGNETDSDNADAALQTELNDTQTGSGLAANGNYNTNTGTNYLDGATSLDNADDLLDAQVAVNTAAIAAGTGALQTELDDTQTGAGLGTDGSYATNTGTNYIDAATTLDGADDLLDAAIAGVQADVDGNETDSDNADAALQTELNDTQTGSGLAANGNYNTNTGTNYLDGATSLDNADDLLDAQVAVNTAAIAAGTGALQTELDDTQTGAGLGTDGSYVTNTGTNYIDAATTLDGADDLLDAAIAGVQADVDGNETDSDNADAALQTELDDTQTGSGLAANGNYNTNTGTNYLDGATSLDNADDLLDAQVAVNTAAIAAGTGALQTELDDTQTGAGLAANGNYNTNTGTNYLDGATSLDNADDLLDAQVAVNTAAIAAGTGALQTELDDTQTGAGLGTDGSYATNTGTNYIDAATTLDGADDLLDAAIAGVQADVDGNETDSDNADAALQTELNDTQTGSGLAANGNYNTNTGTNYLDGATSLDNADDLLDAQVAVNTAAIAAGTGALQTELDDTQTGAGLGTDGSYATNTGTNYIDAATTLDGADDLLDAAIAGVQADVDGNETDSDNADAALQTELNDTQTGSGLAANGNYNTNTGTNYLDGATSLDNADDLLDAQVAVNTAAIAAGTGALQTELDDTQTGAGLGTDGSYATNTGTNYIDAATTLDGADDLLDAAIAGVQADVDGNETDSDNADAALQTELNDTQTGSGLAANGNYNTNTGTNYLDGATSLDNADDLLDAQVAVNTAAIAAGTGALQTELDDTQTGAGLGTDGSYATNTGTNYIDAATSLDNADDLLDAAIAGVQADVDGNETDSDNADAALQTELNDTQTGSGLAANGNYNTNTGTNYLDGATSLDNADDLLDAQVAVNTAAIAAGTGALQTELDDTQTGAGLGTDGSYATNTGTNYIDAATTLDGADDLLDAAIAGVQADVDGNETDSDNADAALQTELNDTQTGSGLAANGNYNTNTGTNYLDGATSLDNADDLLDAAVAGIASTGTALQSELDATQTGSGLAANGAYNTNTGTNFIDGATSLDNADDLLDAAVAGKQDSDPDLDTYAGITPSTDVQAALGAATDAALRTEIGLEIGTNVQAYNANLDTYAGIAPSTDVQAALGAATDAALRTEIGLEIGTDVQAYDAGLADIAGLTPTDNNIVIGNGTNFVTESGATARTSLGLSIGSDVQAYNANLNTYSGIAPSTDVQAALGAATDAALRTEIGLEIGTNVQAYNANLDTYAGIAPSTDVQAALGAATDAALRTEIGLEIGTDVQAYDAGLADIAGLTPTDNNIVIGNGTNFVTESGATARTSLGLSIGSDVQAYNANLDTYSGIAPSTDVQAALGAATDAALRTEIGLEIGTNVQAYNANLDTYAGIAPSTDVQAALGAATDAALRTEIGLEIGTNVQAYNANLDTYAGVAPSTDVQAALGAATDAALRTEIGLEIGTDVQAYDAGLADIAGLTPTDNNIVIGNGTNFVTESGATARTSLGLAIGSDVQAYNANLDTYAGIAPSTDVQAALGAATDAALRTEIGLEIGTNVQAYNANLDTYAGIAPSTDVQAALGAATDAALRTEIGLEIGTDVQAYDAGLADIAGLTPTDNNIVIGNGTNFVTESGATARTSLGLSIGSDVQAYNANLDTYSGIAPSTDVQAALGAATDAALRTEIGLEIGTDVQAYDAGLADIAGLTPTDNNIVIGNGTNFVTETGATARTSLGLAIGSDVQAYDSDLADIAGLTPTDNNIIIGDGSNFVTETGATARASLGLAIGTNVQAFDADLTTYAGITPSADVQAALGAATDAALRTEIGLGGLATLSSVSSSEIDANAVTSTEIATSVAGNGLTGGGGVSLSVQANGDDIEVGASGIRLAQDAATNGQVLKWNGSGWEPAADATSDIRLKRDIVVIPDALARILAIRGVNYFYRTDEFEDMDFSKKKQYGVIAQEVMKVFPELVRKGDDGFYRVNYEQMTSILIAAMQEQQQQIENLNEKVASQESKLTELDADNKEMKSDLDLIKKMLLGDKTVKNEKE